MRQTTDTTWKQLKRGDQFVCPQTGATDEVVFNSPNTKGQRFIRTKTHDHLELPDELVAKFDTEAAASSSSVLSQIIGEWIETWTMGEVKAESLDSRMADDLVERLRQRGITLDSRRSGTIG